MAKNGGMNGGARTNYPSSPGEIAQCSKDAHIPFGGQMLDQSEKGADSMAAAHSKVQDHGKLSRETRHPYAKASPMEGDPGLPFTPKNYGD